MLSEAKHKSTFSEILRFFRVVFHKWCGNTLTVLHKTKPDVPWQCPHSKNGEIYDLATWMSKDEFLSHFNFLTNDLSK